MVKTHFPGAGSTTVFPSLDIRVVDDVGHTRVSVAGEIDLATTPALRSCLQGNLAASFNDIRLDLSGVTFIDSTGLAVILAARQSWIDSGASFTIEAESPVVQRLKRILQVVGAAECEETRHVG